MPIPDKWINMTMVWLNQFVGRPFDQFGQGINDHIAIIPRNAAKIFFTAYKEVETCRRRTYYDADCHFLASTMPQDVPPECIMSGWLRRNGLKYDNGNILGFSRYCKWLNPNGPRVKCRKCPSSFGGMINTF